MVGQYTHEENRVAFYTTETGTKKMLIVVEKSADHN